MRVRAKFYMPSVPIKRIEKDFLISNASITGIPLKCIVSNKEHIFHINETSGEKISLNAEGELTDFYPGKKIDFTFDYNSAIIAFNTRVLEVKPKKLSVSLPDFLFQNPQRNFERVPLPEGVEVKIKKEEDFFYPDVIDISIIGFRFAETAEKTLCYEKGIEFEVIIKIKEREIRCHADILRKYNNIEHIYYGCKFGEMELEDVRFLFEYIYERTLSGEDIEKLNIDN